MSYARWGFSWPLPEGLDDAALKVALFPTLPPTRVPWPEPDWEHVHRELQHHAAAAPAGVPDGASERLPVEPVLRPPRRPQSDGPAATSRTSTPRTGNCPPTTEPPHCRCGPGHRRTRGRWRPFEVLDRRALKPLPAQRYESPSGAGPASTSTITSRSGRPSTAFPTRWPATKPTIASRSTARNVVVFHNLRVAVRLRSHRKGG